MQRGNDLPVLISNCTSEGTDGVLGRKTSPSKAIVIPPGKRGPAVTSARQTFFRSEVTDPRQGVRRQARLRRQGRRQGRRHRRDRGHDQGRPRARQGRHRLPAPRPVSRDEDDRGLRRGLLHRRRGHGLAVPARSCLGRPAPADEGQEVAVFHVQNARNVTLEGFRVVDASVLLRRPGRDQRPARGLRRAVAGHLQRRGRLHPVPRAWRRTTASICGCSAASSDFDNCQRATILAEQIYPSRHPQSKRFNTTLRVRGKDQSVPKDGFLGHHDHVQRRATPTTSRCRTARIW